MLPMHKKINHRTFTTVFGVIVRVAKVVTVHDDLLTQCRPI